LNTENKLKIVMGMDEYLPDVDGVVRCMNNYCRVLSNQAEVTAIVPKNRKNYVDNFPYKVIRCRSFYVPILRQYYGIPANDRKFKKQVYSGEYDIIHLHSPFNMGKFALKMARAKNIPIVATFHTNFRPIFKSIFKSKFITEKIIKSIGRFFNKLDEIFVCSPEVEKQARSFGYTGKISYMPFGTNFEKVADVEALAARADEKFNTDKDELVFLYVGRLMELKRIDYILESLKIVKDKGIKFRFYICGKGMYENKLKDLCKKLGLTDEEVVFTGFLGEEEVKLLYARSDLFLFPSLYDTFGLVKVEAAAFGTPCMLIKDSAAAFGVTDNKNGYISEDSVEQFAHRIIEAVSDRKKLKETGENAARDLYFNWSDCTDILMKKYKEIIDEKTKPKEV